MRGKIVAVAVVILSIIGCAEEPKMQVSDRILENCRYKIRQFSAILKEDQLNKIEILANSDSLLHHVKCYLIADPTSSYQMEYLTLQGETYMRLGRGIDAIHSFNSIMKQYPEHKNKPEILYKKALSYELIIRDENAAVKTYNQLIHHYPNHPRTDFARVSVSQLLKPDTEEKFISQR